MWTPKELWAPLRGDLPALMSYEIDTQVLNLHQSAAITARTTWPWYAFQLPAPQQRLINSHIKVPVSVQKNRKPLTPNPGHLSRDCSHILWQKPNLSISQSTECSPIDHFTMCSKSVNVVGSIGNCSGEARPPKVSSQESRLLIDR